MIATRSRASAPVVIGGLVFAAVCFAVTFAPLLAPYDPAHQVLTDRLARPSSEHWLGTDHLGRDWLSRLLYGGRFSISIAAISLTLGAVIGTIVGALSARVGGHFDEVVMRTCDLLLAFPDVLLALVLISVLQPSFFTLILAMSVVGWTTFARLTRGLTLEINTKEFIEAAEALGCSRGFIIFRHVIPNALGPVLAMALLQFSYKLITVGGLSYLGLGVQPPDADWGSMLATAQPYMELAPWLLIAPAVAIFVTAFAVTVAGQALQEGRGRRRVVVDAEPGVPLGTASSAPIEAPA